MTNSPFDVIKNDYTIDELNDIVEHGCASGCAHQHIYYSDTNSFFDQHDYEIVSYIRDAIGSEFVTETFDNNEGNLTGYKNDIVWTFIELYAMELIDNINNEEVEEEEEIVNNYSDLKYVFSSLTSEELATSWSTQISSIKYTLVHVIVVLMYTNQREIILIYYILVDFSLFFY